MSNTDLEYLFTPGAGVVPPYLAGREQEQGYFDRCVKALKNRKPIARGLSDKDEPITDSRILDNLDQLYQLGYVWRVEGFDYEPGVPSLMNYVQKYAQP